MGGALPPPVAGTPAAPAAATTSAPAPAVVADLSGERAPATTFGLVVEGLRRRRERGVGPFTLMSCDNIPGNGEVARRAFTSYARALAPALAAWAPPVVAILCALALLLHLEEG